MWQLAKVCAALLTIFCVGEVVVLATSRPAYRSPFAPYEVLLAGQPAAAAPCDLHPVGTPSQAMPVVGTSYCAVYPEQGIFASIAVYADEDQIIQTTLRLVSPSDGNSLYLGDLMLRWGRPDMIVTDKRSIYLRWTANGTFALVYPRGATPEHLDYWLTITSMTVGLLGSRMVIP